MIRLSDIPYDVTRCSDCDHKGESCRCPNLLEVKYDGTKYYWCRKQYEAFKKFRNKKIKEIGNHLI